MSTRRYGGAAKISASKLEEDQRISPALIQALNHPIRRETLRLLHRSEEAQSAQRLSQSMVVVGTIVSYHLRALAKLNVVTLVDEWIVRGVPEKFFVSEVSSHRKVVEILADTNHADRAIRK